MSALNRVGVNRDKIRNQVRLQNSNPYIVCFISAGIHHTKLCLIITYLIISCIWVTKTQKNKVGLGAPDQEARVIAGRYADQSITKRLHQSPHGYR